MKLGLFASSVFWFEKKIRTVICVDVFIIVIVFVHGFSTIHGWQILDSGLFVIKFVLSKKMCCTYI